VALPHRGKGSQIVEEVSVEPPMHTPKDVERLLDAPGGRALDHPCDLDLMKFFHRHPRTLLTSEHLAACVGYDVQQVGRSLETLISTGLVTRSQNPKSAARLYVLASSGPLVGWLGSLLTVAATQAGRRALNGALRRRLSARGPTEASGKPRKVPRARFGRAKEKAAHG
jgi:hypothetical protein